MSGNVRFDQFNYFPDQTGSRPNPTQNLNPNQNDSIQTASAPENIKSRKRKLEDESYLQPEKNQKVDDLDRSIDIVTQHYNQGMQQFYQGNYQQAILHFLECKKHGDAPMYLQLGIALEEQCGKGHDSAIDAYKTALTWPNEDGNFTVHVILGKALKSRHRPDFPSLESLYFARTAFMSALNNETVHDSAKFQVQNELAEVEHLIKNFHF